MQDSLPDAGPARYQLWAVTGIYGPIALILLTLVLRGFPISDPATALGAFPKLAANADCVESLSDTMRRDYYALRYANFAVWMSVFGGILGLTMRRANRGVWWIKADPNGYDAGRCQALKSGHLRKLGGYFPAIVVGCGLFLVLPWWIVFHASACSALSSGLPEYRAFGGILPAGLLGFPGFVAGLTVDGGLLGLACAWRWLREQGKK